MANAAIYIIYPAVFMMGDCLRSPSANFSVEVIPQLLGRTVAWAGSGHHEDIGTFETNQKVNSAEVINRDHRGS